MNLTKYVLIVCLLLAIFPLSAQFSGRPGFADTDGPYKPMVTAEANAADGTVVFQFLVESRYHITDRKNNFFTIEPVAGQGVEIVDLRFPTGTPYGPENDHVFKGQFAVTARLKTPALTAPREVSFTVSFQICQEQPTEQCFAPDSSTVRVTLPAGFQGATGAAAAPAAAGKKPSGTLLERLAEVIRRELPKASLLLFLLVFLAGFLTSLTPCVYPVIPLVMGYVGSRTGGKKLKGFYLSVIFILGLAFVYSLLGVVAAKTGAMMGISFQNPLVVIVIAAIFILMGLSLGGLFTIPVPTALTAKVGKGYKNELIGSFIIGGISGVIAAPCVGPVLIALLSWISQTGNVWLGFWVTFVFSLGMSVIFLVAGTFSGAVSSLPRGGAWMETIKYIFSVLLIGGGLFILKNIMASWLNLVLWGIFLMTVAVFAGVLKPLADEEHKTHLARLPLILLMIVGVFLFWHGLESRYFPAAGTPAKAAKAERLPWIPTLEEGQRQAAAQQKPLLIDSYADWCENCIKLDEETYSDPRVEQALARFVLVKLDFTDNADPQTIATRKKLGVIGMPTVIFLGPDGKELKRFSGFQDADTFLSTISGL